MPKILALGLVVAGALTPSANAATMSVVVLADHDLRRLEKLSHQGAVGLLVPDAGPQTSRERALAALQRGEVRNSLLGGEQQGPVLIRKISFRDLQRATGPTIVVGLPRPGTRPNDRRYPIAVIAPGYRGILTSQSTRIPGLVSIVDVAPTALGLKGKLGSTPAEIPVLTLANLDLNIDRHRDAKAPFLLISLALIALFAAFWRQGVLAALAGVLLANLVLGMTSWSEEWAVLLLVVFGCAAGLFGRLGLPAQGLLLATVLVAYLAAMWIDPTWVALSPLGPTQNARFYGLSNLLSTLLLVPALASAAILGGWAAAVVAALALVTVGGSRFGADGGGVLVLLTGYAVLFALTQRANRRTLFAAAAVLVALVAALALGGGSHVTTAIADGPAGLAEDFWRRLHLSWLRATSSWGVALLVFGGMAVLAVLGLRERRPLLLAYLAALAVSLLVNDSPNDVIVAGLAGYLVLSTAPGVARPAAERARPAAPAPRARSAPAASR
jgi:hypothetical protein